MKIALYSPYVPKHAGGGEKHFFDVARILSQHHEVTIAIPEIHFESKLVPEFLEKYQKFVGQSLSKLHWTPTPLGTAASATSKLPWTASFDGLYVVSDGSWFLSFARHNHLHLQIPFTNKLSTWQHAKLHQWTLNTNSQFTKKIIENRWQKKVKFVLEPYVEAPPTPVFAKQKMVLHVGRFFTHLHNKRHDVLIEAWKRWCFLHPHLAAHWKLVMVGQIESGAEQYVESLHREAQGYPIQFLHECGHEQLQQLYQHASVYWHATGFEVAEYDHPEQVEHFGISTLEAMSHSAIPLVIPKGGQAEILASMHSDLGWETLEELVTKTSTLIRAIESHQPLCLGTLTKPVDEWRTQLHQRSLWYNEARFSRTLLQMFPVRTSNL